MKNNRYNLFLVVVFVFGVIFSAILNLQRYNVEKVNNTVEQSIEYGAVQRLAASEGLTIEKTLNLLKERGVTTLVLFDTNLQRLSERADVVVLKGSDLLKLIPINKDQSDVWFDLVKTGKIKSEAVYITKAKSQSIFDDVKEDVFLRFGKDKVAVISTSPEIIEIKGDLTSIKNYNTSKIQRGLMNLDLGILSEELAIAKKNKMNVFIRPVNYANLYNKGAASPKEQIDSLFKRIDDSKANVTAFTGSGRYILGYNWDLKYVAQELEKRNITLAMVESPVQLKFVNMLGLTEMAKLMNYKVVRTYLVSQEELKKIDFETAVRRWDLTDKERNVRMNYLKNMTVPINGKTLLETNLDYFDSITKRVTNDGFKIGRASIYEAYMPIKEYFVPLAFAIVAAMILCLNQIFLIKRKYQVALLIIFGGLFSYSVLTSYALVTRQILALIAAVCVPVFAICSFVSVLELDAMKKDRNSLIAILLKTTLGLILTTLVSLVGASFVGAILGDIRFFLEIEIYRGVKLTFLLPLILSLVIFVRKYYFSKPNSLKEYIDKLKTLLDSNIKVFHVLIALIIAFIGFVYIGRSGHTAGIPVSGLEIKLRWFFEDAMYARPRTKEFLIGHPMFYLLALSFYKNFPKEWKIVFLVLATMGQSSLVQTFAHMRTPILMSYIRAWDGVLVGAVLGIIGVIAISVLLKLVKKVKRSYFTNER